MRCNIQIAAIPSWALLRGSVCAGSAMRLLSTADVMAGTRTGSVAPTAVCVFRTCHGESADEAAGQSAHRLVFSEADGLSGLTVDRYGDWLLIQFTSRALAERRVTFVRLLEEKLRPAGVWLRTEKGIGESERLELSDGLVAGREPPRPIFIEEHGIRYGVDVVQGQKTGFYLDQRANRRAVAEYVRGGRAVNGVVFEWVGESGGDYLPVRLLPKPERRQIVDIAGSIEPVAGLEIFGEVAHSGHDVNRLSDLSATEQGGGAYLAGVRLQPMDLAGGRLQGEVGGRVRGATFTPFERIRPIEFNRQWNIARAGSGLIGIDSLREETFEGFVEWGRDSGTTLRLEGGRLGIGDRFDGHRGGFSLRLAEAGLPMLTWRADYVDASNGLLGEEGTWLRQSGRISQPVGGGLEPFVEIEHERRAQHVLGTDSLAATALSFYEVRPGLALSRGGLSTGLAVGWREEQQPLEGRFSDAATALTLRSDLRYRAGSTFNTEAEAAYRRRLANDAFREHGLGDVESVAMRWSTRWSPFDRAADLSTVYTASTERTPILQEMFIRVGPELGEWVWEDLNGDGIQQIDEFRPQNFPLEGEYMRVFVPGDELRPTAAVGAQVRLRLDPSRLWNGEAAAWQRALSTVQSMTTLDLHERTEADDLLAVYLLRPDILQQPETTLNGRLRIAQELTFFRDEPRYGGRLAASHLRSTATLAAGVDEREVQRLEGEAQYQLQPAIAIEVLKLARSAMAGLDGEHRSHSRTDRVDRCRVAAMCAAAPRRHHDLGQRVAGDVLSADGLDRRCHYQSRFAQREQLSVAEVDERDALAQACGGDLGRRGRHPSLDGETADHACIVQPVAGMRWLLTRGRSRHGSLTSGRRH
jgi:hypothetical protein